MAAIVALFREATASLNGFEVERIVGWPESVDQLCQRGHQTRQMDLHLRSYFM